MDWVDLARVGFERRVTEPALAGVLRSPGQELVLCARYRDRGDSG